MWTVTVWTKAIKIFTAFQAALLLLWVYSFTLFINVEVAFLSAFFILLGSMYSYVRLVNRRVEDYHAAEDRDAVEKIEDPFDLYSETEPVEAVDPENVDLKALIKEEKARIKSSGATKNTVKSAPAMASLYRLIPYLLLVLGFIGLKNNNLLALWPYLFGLGIGIVGGFAAGRALFAPSVRT
jgi:hypothetical protein